MSLCHICNKIPSKVKFEAPCEFPSVKFCGKKCAKEFIGMMRGYYSDNLTKKKCFIFVMI